MQFQTIADLPEVRVLGRTGDSRSPVALFWTASGLELTYDGSELWLVAQVDYDTHEPWISVEVNGAWLIRMPLHRGANEVCLFRGLSAGKPKHVRIFKETQAMSADERHSLLVLGLRHVGGRFLPLPAPKYRIEFVGDSITSGEGAAGARCEEDWASAFFSVTRHYALLTADALGAEPRVVSQSGWGVLCSWDNDPHCALPRVYDLVCGPATGKTNAALGAQSAYDFSAWRADAVVINLGTNDNTAFNIPEWRDERTGEAFKQHLLPDGSYDPADLERLRQAVIGFLRQARRRNPTAKLVWAYGMLGEPLKALLLSALHEYQAESGDKDAYLLMLPDTVGDGYGARNHPGAISHEAAAKVLTAFLKELLGA